MASNRIINAAIICGLLIATVGMEALFVSNMFGGSWAGYAIVLMVITLNGIKIRLSFAVPAASRWWKLGIVALWASLTVVSFAAAVGFLAHVRQEILAERIGKLSTIKALDAQISEARMRVGGSQGIRDETVIQADIAGHLAKPMLGQSVGAAT